MSSGELSPEEMRIKNLEADLQLERNVSTFLRTAGLGLAEENAVLVQEIEQLKRKVREYEQMTAEQLGRVLTRSDRRGR